MKISYNWLKDYLECDLTPEAVAQALTSIGLEVDALEETEEKTIRAAMARFGGNLSMVAKSLEISRPTLYAKLKKYNI